MGMQWLIGFSARPQGAKSSVGKLTGKERAMASSDDKRRGVELWEP